MLRVVRQGRGQECCKNAVKCECKKREQEMNQEWRITTKIKKTRIRKGKTRNGKRARRNKRQEMRNKKRETRREKRNTRSKRRVTISKAKITKKRKAIIKKHEAEKKLYRSRSDMMCVSRVTTARDEQHREILDIKCR